MTDAPGLARDERAGGAVLAQAPLAWSFIGDSVTAGSWHTWGARGYPELFQERLREIERRRDGVVNTAVSGWRVENLRDELDQVCLRYSPDVVVIGTGLNDTRGGAEGVGAFGETYRDLVDRVRSESGAMVVTQTPNGTLPTAPQHVVSHTGAYAQEIREISAELGTVLVDHLWVWENTGSDTVYHWLGHGCHPNAFGHRAMARSLLQVFGLWDPAGSRTCRLTLP
ncbi:SGNH/GDSL hydrolase family protein [Georgenia halophila]|uniref:SGNH/GDSL hydrolase family protein n=1 Tax=Georgenia halophila TaxID=620889 RepID=A0ABP8LKI0_9MICO